MHDKPPLTIGKAADVLDIPKGTVRGWVNRYNHHLSASANPPKGETKLLTPDDMVILWTVYYLRARHKSIDEIDQAIAAGERYNPDPQPETEPQSEPHQTAQDDQDAPQPVEGDQSIGASFTAALVTLESRLTVMDDRIAELTDLLVDAEKRAAAAETELRMMRAAAQDATPTGSAPTDNTGDTSTDQVDQDTARQSLRVRFGRWLMGE